MHLHDNNFYYGDLKPQNILINEKTLQISFSDFGGTVYLKEGELNF